jgi:predicted N-acetyltransferase YhbS
MTLSLRKGREQDAPVAGEICYRAFKTIADAHNFPPDFPAPEIAIRTIGGLIGHEKFFDVVAEQNGRIVGSNFLDERGPIAAVGPITVDPAAQNDDIGRALMQAVLTRSHERDFAGVRLVQAGYHCRSLALYLKLGFLAREHLSCLQGPTVGKAPEGFTVRAATAADASACNALCFRVHGHDRAGELAEAIAQGSARVVERAGRITGYTTVIAFFGHAVGETNDDITALLAAAPEILAAGVLVPTRNGELMRWCFDHGLRITQAMTLMTMGLYNEPRGAWIPSVMY